MNFSGSRRCVEDLDISDTRVEGVGGFRHLRSTVHSENKMGKKICSRLWQEVEQINIIKL